MYLQQRQKRRGSESGSGRVEEFTVHIQLEHKRLQGGCGGRVEVSPFIYLLIGEKQ